jgi:hypothetical protein
MKRTLCREIPDFARPNLEMVERAVNFPDCWLASAIKPTKDPEEWDRDHSAWYIARVFPVLDLPLRLRRICCEAYLTDGLEEWCDGSSVVPDSKRYGYCKDFQGVMHDYIFWTHHKGLPDAYGHVWTYDEANRAYRDAWIADGQAFRGWLYYAGLTVGAWPVWCGWL